MTRSRPTEDVSTRGTDGGKKLLRACIQLPIFAALCLLSAADSSAEGPRTLALVDFAVRAPGTRGAELSWLGPAVSELLQAKLQLFGGVRVLERQRVRGLLQEAKAGAGAALDDPGALSGILPAEVLIAGSVSVDPQDPQRIRVQARAFEVETSKIVSEAAFSGTGDLAGLLKIAEDLAKTLADGLKLAYTPEQLAYAEPAKIDTLRFFVDGEAHLTAGRHREAITSFQQALDGNEGRYYAAAHRLQGEAYQALAKASAGEQERKVREEYLKKFKDDVFAASGALYDLGLAYEANGLWKEAEEAYRDYLATVGPEGELVRWRNDLRVNQTPDALYFEGEKFIHLLPGSREITYRRSAASRWITLEASTGRIAREVDLPKLSRELGEEGPTHFIPIGFEEGRAYFRWAMLKIGRREEGVQIGQMFVLALGPSREPLWRFPLPGVPQYTAFHKGRIFLGSQGDLLTLDAADGRLLSRIPKIERSSTGFPKLTGLDLDGARFTTGAGEVYDLNTGRIVERYDKERILWPTGRPEVTYLRERDGIRLFSQGRERFFLGGVGSLVFPGVSHSGDRPSKETSSPPAPSAGPLVFGSSRGYKVVNPDTGEVVSLFADLAGLELPALVGASGSTLVFLDEAPPKEIGTRHRWGETPEGKIIRLNVFEAPSGRFLGKRNLDLEDLNDWPYRIFPAGDDIVYSGTGGLTRVKAAVHRGREIVPAAMAGLRIGYCRLRQDDPAGAIKAAGRFEAEFPQDHRGLLLRIEEAVSRGDEGEAGRLAVRALGSGALDEGERERCLRLLQKIHPEVRKVIATAARRQLKFHAWANDGTLVCSTGSATSRAAFLLVDTASGRIRRVDPVGFSRTAALLHRGEYIYGLPEGVHRILRFNLLTGEKLFSPDDHPIPENRWRIPAVEVGALRVRGNEPWELVAFDPQTLAILSVTSLGRAGPNPRFSGNDTVVFVEPSAYEEKAREKTPEVLVVDRLSGRELGRFVVPLHREVLRGVAADRSALYLTVAGADWDSFEAGEKGLWYRVISFPLAAGGAAWTYENEGWMAGNPVIEEDAVSFPAIEGHLEVERFQINNFSKIKEAILKTGPPISRIRVERRGGTRLGEETLPGNPWDNPPNRRGPMVLHEPNPQSWSVSLFGYVGNWSSPQAPLRLLAGRTETVNDDYRDYREFWSPALGARPVQVALESVDREYKVDISRGFENLQLFRKDTVYESIGGGVILEKDLAGGKGRENIAPYQGY